MTRRICGHANHTSSMRRHKYIGPCNLNFVIIVLYLPVKRSDLKLKVFFSFVIFSGFPSTTSFDRFSPPQLLLTLPSRRKSASKQVITWTIRAGRTAKDKCTATSRTRARARTVGLIMLVLRECPIDHCMSI